jgi:hypothetical protein
MEDDVEEQDDIEEFMTEEVDDDTESEELIAEEQDYNLNKNTQYLKAAEVDK